MAELDLIERIKSLSAAVRNPSVRLGIGDDCAILRVPPRHEVVVTTDLFLEGRHFRRDWHSPESAGHRCLARGLSDLAAMGAKPLAAFLSLALPATYDPVWLDRFMAGFMALATLHDVQLAGGDTAQAPGQHILADIVLTGAAPTGRALRRASTQPGDLLYMTGTLGGSALELARLATHPGPVAPNPPHTPQSFPEPRLMLGQALLRRRLASVCMDISDGLSTDLTHLCHASKVSAELILAALPIASGASLAQALHGGEDYELLFTASPQTRMPKRLAGTSITQIGRILPRVAETITTISPQGTLQPGGWEHFA